MNRIIRSFLIFSLLSAALHAQQPRVITMTAPDHPVEGSMLTLTLLVEHSEPDEVNVVPPRFTNDILLDFILKGPRVVIPDADRWTAIEFCFTTTGSGTITFEPFTIITPQGQKQTAPFNIIVQKPGGVDSKNNGIETMFFRLSWENVPANLKVGENAIISLRVNGWKNNSVLPESGSFLPPVPMGHIVESLPISENEKTRGIVLKLRIIPLQTGVLTMQNRRLTIENAIYEVPVLRIPVSSAVKTEPR